MNKKLLKYSAIPAIIGLLLGWSDWAVARDVIERDCYLVMLEIKDTRLVRNNRDYSHDIVARAVSKGILPRIKTKILSDFGRQATGYHHRDYD